MKKVILIILSLCLLTGCVTVPPESAHTTQGTQSLQSTQTPQATQSTQAAPGVEPQFDLTPMPGFDADNRYIQLNYMGFLETEDTFYNGGTVYVRYRMKYYDRATGISGLLCADPACTHDTIECGGQTLEKTTISYYDGKLYWVEAGSMEEGWDYFLYRSDPDGRNREKVKRIDYQDMVLVYQPQNFIVHRGMVYLLGSCGSIEGGVIGMRRTVLASPLDETEEWITVYDKTLTELLYDVRFVGNTLFICERYGDSDNSRCTVISQYDIPTGITRVIYEETDAPPYVTSFWVTQTGDVYFSDGNDDSKTLWKLEAGKKCEVFPSAKGFNYLMENLYARTWQENERRFIELRTLEGEQLYQGYLFPETIPGVEGDLDTAPYAIVGGDTEKIILAATVFTDGYYMTEYVLMLDPRNNMKATILWQESNAPINS